MWKVGDKSTMKVVCNPESNFPISIELDFGGRPGTPEHAQNSWGMWFGVEDAEYLIRKLERAIRVLEDRNAQDGQLELFQNPKFIGPVTSITNEDIEAIDLT